MRWPHGWRDYRDRWNHGYRWVYRGWAVGIGIGLTGLLTHVSCGAACAGYTLPITASGILLVICWAAAWRSADGIAHWAGWWDNEDGEDYALANHRAERKLHITRALLLVTYIAGWAIIGTYVAVEERWWEWPFGEEP